MSRTIDKYLCIGHCCHDKVESGYILGGTASYASIVAQNLGKTTSILTSVGRDFLFKDYFIQKGIVLHNVEAEETTVFHNIYDSEGNRTQYLLSRAELISPGHIISKMQDHDILQLCLIADEVDWSILDHFDGAIVGATIQGCLRQWDESGKISAKEMDWSLLAKVDVAIFSTQDIKGFEHRLSTIVTYCKHVVITDGADGATVYFHGDVHHFPSIPVNEVDATGAGDVFTASYLVRYAETNDIASSCVFAHSAASFIIEGEGLSHLPSRDKIEKRAAAYRF